MKAAHRSVLVVPVARRGGAPAFWLARAGRAAPAPPTTPVGDDESQLAAVKRALARSDLPRADRIYATPFSLPAEDGTPFGTSVFVAVMGLAPGPGWQTWPAPGRAQVPIALRDTLDRIHDRFVRATPDEALRVG